MPSNQWRAESQKKLLQYDVIDLFAPVILHSIDLLKDAVARPCHSCRCHVIEFKLKELLSSK
jgi:hypothetical protein